MGKHEICFTDRCAATQTKGLPEVYLGFPSARGALLVLPRDSPAFPASGELVLKPPQMTPNLGTHYFSS